MRHCSQVSGPTRNESGPGHPAASHVPSSWPGRPLFCHGRAWPHRHQDKQRTEKILPRARLYSLRHDRAWPGHPRLCLARHRKSWVAGPSPAMTNGEDLPTRQLILMPMGPSPAMTSGQILPTKRLILMHMGLGPATRDFACRLIRSRRPWRAGRRLGRCARARFHEGDLAAFCAACKQITLQRHGTQNTALQLGEDGRQVVGPRKPRPAWRIPRWRPAPGRSQRGGGHEQAARGRHAAGLRGVLA